MGFMQPEIYETDYYAVETNGGTWFVPGELVSLSIPAGQVWTDDDVSAGTWKQACDQLRNYIEPPEIWSIEFRHGWLGRYQVPGYLDATDWSAYETYEEAERELREMYGDDESEDA